MDNVPFKPNVDELTFKSVVALRGVFYHALLQGKNNRFCLDLSDVMHCDSAGLALLIETRKLCKNNNKVFDIIGMPSDIQSLAEFCGVKNILETA